MSRPLNFRQLEAFRAVMLTGSMTDAGKLLNISQPAVTRLVRDLEADLALVLFRRLGARITPTREGRQLYREVERHFTGGDRIREAARAIKERRSGHLQIGAMLTLSTSCLPKAVHRLLEQHPDVTVSIHSDSSLNIVDMVAHGQLDVGFGSIPAYRADVVHAPLAAVEAVCVMKPGHRLARRKTINVTDLDGENFIALGSSSFLRLQIEEAMRATGVRARIRLSALYSSTVAGYIAAGVGLAVTDPFAILGPGRERLAIRRFRPRLPFQFSAIYRAEEEHSSLATDFVQIVRDVISVELSSLGLGLRNTV